MDRQIVDLDPGENYNAAKLSLLVIRTSKWKKEIYMAVLQIVARLQIVMLDDTVLSRKILVGFEKT